MPLRLAIALVLLMIARSVPAGAAARIVSPWPEPRPGQVRTETVTLRSSDPFTPGDLGTAAPRSVQATLYLPPGAAPDGSTPAVVFLHGSAGLTAERGERYGRELAGMGVASLVVATYDSRADLGRSYLDRVLNITETMFVADAYAGLLYLAGRPEIDAHHVVLTGFSYGGMAATYAMYGQLADRVVPRFRDGRRLVFAGHVAFYAPCIARFRDSRTTGAPLLMLYGDKDELIVPARCAEVASDLRGGGSPVTVISYPGAVHQWDGALAPRLIGRHLGDCSFTVDRDGGVTDDRTHFPMSGPFLRKLILGLCTTSDPYPIGRNDLVRQWSNRDFGAFLSRVFAAPPPG